MGLDGMEARVHISWIYIVTDSPRVDYKGSSQIYFPDDDPEAVGSADSSAV